MGRVIRVYVVALCICMYVLCVCSSRQIFSPSSTQCASSGVGSPTGQSPASCGTQAPQTPPEPRSAPRPTPTRRRRRRPQQAPTLCAPASGAAWTRVPGCTPPHPATPRKTASSCTPQATLPRKRRLRRLLAGSAEAAGATAAPGSTDVPTTTPAAAAAAAASSAAPSKATVRSATAHPAARTRRRPTARAEQRRWVGCAAGLRRLLRSCRCLRWRQRRRRRRRCHPPPRARQRTVPPARSRRRVQARSRRASCRPPPRTTPPCRRPAAGCSQPASLVGTRSGAAAATAAGAATQRPPRSPRLSSCRPTPSSSWSPTACRPASAAAHRPAGSGFAGSSVRATASGDGGRGGGGRLRPGRERATRSNGSCARAAAAAAHRSRSRSPQRRLRCGRRCTRHRRGADPAPATTAGCCRRRHHRRLLCLLLACLVQALRTPRRRCQLRLHQRTLPRPFLTLFPLGPRRVQRGRRHHVVRAVGGTEGEEIVALLSLVAAAAAPRLHQLVGGVEGQARRRVRGKPLVVEEGAVRRPEVGEDDADPVRIVREGAVRARRARVRHGDLSHSRVLAEQVEGRLVESDLLCHLTPLHHLQHPPLSRHGQRLRDVVVRALQLHLCKHHPLPIRHVFAGSRLFQHLRVHPTRAEFGRLRCRRRRRRRR
eukprot:Rhum_TRINITY_DN14319_c7_g2::Rhum_TRINITY_DN14319_c7_g2_i1::g.81711::m.81711